MGIDNLDIIWFVVHSRDGYNGAFEKMFGRGGTRSGTVGRDVSSEWTCWMSVCINECIRMWTISIEILPPSGFSNVVFWGWISAANVGLEITCWWLSRWAQSDLLCVGRTYAQLMLLWWLIWSGVNIYAMFLPFMVVAYRRWENVCVLYSQVKCAWIWVRRVRKSLCVKAQGRREEREEGLACRERYYVVSCILLDKVKWNGGETTNVHVWEWGMAGICGLCVA